MMKIYICPKCGWLRLVSRRRVVDCFKCQNPQMTLTNLTLGKYSDMSQEERDDYSKAWRYIHNRKGSN